MFIPESELGSREVEEVNGDASTLCEKSKVGGADASEITEKERSAVKYHTKKRRMKFSELS